MPPQSIHPVLKTKLDRAASLIESADALVIAAGAGMGVDSGLPDFRGTTGFWRAYPALARSKVSFQGIARAGVFMTEPSRAWGFYGHRLALYRSTIPHAGFALLKHWGARMTHGYGVFTSNVDGHFQKAGFDGNRIHECHGSVHHLQCLEPCNEFLWSANAFHPDVDESECRLRIAMPTCQQCGKIARPNVLMFDDYGWVESRSNAQEVGLDLWLAKVKRPVIIEIGAGKAIPSVRNFSARLTRKYGAQLIRINPREEGVANYLGVGLAMGATAALDEMAAILGKGWQLPSY